MMELTPGDLLTVASMCGGKGGGTSDYASLRHKPTINGVTVTGDLSGADLSLATLDSSGRVPAEQLPSATAAPLMDGTADAGSAEAFARADHVHPTDTSRASTAVAVANGANGLMSSADKAKLDSLSIPAGGISMPVTLSSQSVAMFDSAAAGRPLRVTAHIQPQQAAGTPSPENPLPITGWTGVNAARSGKNLLRMMPSAWIGGGITITANSNGSLNISGTNTTANPFSIHLLNTSDAAMMSGLTRFFARGGWMTLSSTTGVYDSTTLNVSIAYQLSTGGNPKYLGLGSSANIPEGSTFLYSTLYITPGTTVQTLNGFALQLEQGGEASAFQPYSADTASFTFPSSIGTVYGGTLDVARGLLTVTHKFINLNTSAMDNFDQYPGWTNQTGIIDCVPVNSNTRVAGAICNIAAEVHANTTNDFAIIWLGATGKTQTELKAMALDVQIAAPLLVPVTYQLTPQQITTLVGANNVFADCGPVTVTHWPGTGTPVEPVEDGAEIEWKKGILDRVDALERR